MENRKYHDCFEAGKYYHIYNRAIGNEKLFRTKENYHYFLNQCIKYLPPVCLVHSWCLLPNHFHFLIQIKDLTDCTVAEKQVLGQFANLFKSYTLAYNKMYSRHGSLFQKGFKRLLVKDEQYLITLMHYIHRNPIHHGLVNHYAHWPFSSYHDLLLPHFEFTSLALITGLFHSPDDFLTFLENNIDCGKQPPGINQDFDTTQVSEY